jgi:hypothetical protein
MVIHYVARHKENRVSNLVVFGTAVPVWKRRKGYCLE